MVRVLQTGERVASTIAETNASLGRHLGVLVGLGGIRKNASVLLVRVASQVSLVRDRSDRCRRASALEDEEPGAEEESVSLSPMQRMNVSTNAPVWSTSILGRVTSCGSGAAAVVTSCKVGRRGGKSGRSGVRAEALIAVLKPRVGLALAVTVSETL